MAQWNTFCLLKFIFIFYQIDSVFSVNFLNSILMVSLNFNNQKNLWVIDFIKNNIILFLFFKKYCVVYLNYFLINKF